MADHALDAPTAWAIAAMLPPRPGTSRSAWLMHLCIAASFAALAALSCATVCDETTARASAVDTTTQRTTCLSSNRLVLHAPAMARSVRRSLNGSAPLDSPAFVRIIDIPRP